jgi:hypothetical protein
MVAAAIGGAAVVGAVGSSVASSNSASASKEAASDQEDAANRSADLQNSQWQQTQSNLAPYLNLGTSSINPLLAAMGYNPDGSVNGGNILQQQFSAPTADQAAATPGYQFTLGQGLKSVQNGAAARGLGASGAAMKGAASYATGLADSTYNDVYNRALTTFNTNYGSAANNANRLSGLVGNGQNAAATNGSLGAAAAGNIGNSLTSGANAAASGLIGSANALSNGISGVSNSALTYGLLQNNASGSGSASSGASPQLLAAANASDDPIQTMINGLQP